MQYLLDSNVLITADASYYELGRFRPFWDWISEEAQRGLVKMPKEQLDEITPEGIDFQLWLRENKASLAVSEPHSIPLLETVLREGYGFAEQNITDIIGGANAHDAILIAYALAEKDNRCVVTLESVQNPRSELPKPTNRKIPLVCRRLGLRCIDTFALIRELDFRIPS